MSEIPKAYEPQAVEAKWYAFWLKENCFTANPASTKPAYSIVIPPPNVTGMLHMGHVLNHTIQDVPHVKHAGDVGRRNDDGVGGLGRSRVGSETILFQPESVPLRFDRLRF